jgi:hypothetical protein
MTKIVTHLHARTYNERGLKSKLENEILYSCIFNLELSSQFRLHISGILVYVGLIEMYFEHHVYQQTFETVVFYSIND